MQDVLAALRYEFEGEENSFLLRLRCELHWDQNAFLKLIYAMQAYLETDRDRQTLERWIAEGFWFTSHFVKEWTSHPNFKKSYSEAYYASAYERLYDLSYWLFMGESPYEDGTLPHFDEKSSDALMNF